MTEEYDDWVPEHEDDEGFHDFNRNYDYDHDDYVLGDRIIDPDMGSH